MLLCVTAYFVLLGSSIALSEYTKAYSSILFLGIWVVSSFELLQHELSMNVLDCVLGGSMHSFLLIYGLISL